MSKSTEKTEHMDSYNPSKSVIDDTAMAQWISAPVHNEMHVPGLGPKCHEALIKVGVDGVFPLFGKFMLFRGRASDSRQCCQHFYEWLGQSNVPGQGGSKHTITRCLAEKINTTYPGFYDPSAYQQTA